MPNFPLISEGVQIAQMYAQATGGIESATAAPLASSGTITTSGPPQVAVARLAPTAAVTAVVLQKGTTPGQECWIVNEAATANSVTMAASGTSNCAGGVNDVIPGGQGRLYVWDDQTTLWYATPQIATVTAFAQSNSAAATATSGTITTSGVNVARVAPAAAITAAVLQAGTVSGQVCVVVNESAIASSVQFAASGTSNVADGVNAVVPGLQTRTFVWNSGTSLWYAHEPTVNGTIDLAQSGSAAATATSGTITTSGVGAARISPASAITATVLQAGTLPGQLCLVVNEAAVANSAQFAASGTSNVADGASCVIPGLQSRLFCWDSGQSLWYEISNLVNGALASIQSASSPAVATSGTISTTGVGVARVTPAAAVTAIVVGAGVYPGQEVVIINESTTAANSVTMAVSGTSNVANGVSTVISGLTCAKLVWDSSTSLWYHAV